MDWLFDFIGKVLAVPELHAILIAVGIGFGLTYTLQKPLPASWPAMPIRVFGNALVFFVVLCVPVYYVRTPQMAGWALTLALFSPLFYEWAMNALYHYLPWLKPKSLMTEAEFVAHLERKAST